MENKEIILLFIILPAILFIAALIFLKSKKFKALANPNYSLVILSKKVIIGRHDLIILGVLLLCFSWLNIFLPLVLSLLLVINLLFIFPTASFKRHDSTSNKENTQLLLDKLTAIEREIEFTKQHFGILQADLAQAQIEVDKKQKIKEELDATILENKNSAETWASMNDAQKNLVSQTAVTAISRKLKGDFWQGMIWGFLINILATLTWTLLGNPGKDDLIKKFNSLTEYIRSL